MGASGIQVLAFAFDSGADAAAIARRVGRIAASDDLEVLDAVIGSRGADGEIDFVEWSEGRGALGEEAPDVQVRALLSADDAAAVGERLVPGQSVAILVIAHRWLERLDADVADAGGHWLLDDWAEPDALEAALAALDS